jgi:hypothetical protein
MPVLNGPKNDYIRASEIASRLSPLVGIQRAHELLDEAIKACKLPKKAMYALEEFKAICEQLRKPGGMIAMLVFAIAGELIITERERR